jgi:hypothetical protein
LCYLLSWHGNHLAICRYVDVAAHLHANTAVLLLHLLLLWYVDSIFCYLPNLDWLFGDDALGVLVSAVLLFEVGKEKSTAVHSNVML